MYVDYNTYGYATDTSSSALGVFGAMMGIMFLIFGVIMIFAIVCQWKLFKKAGRKGWEAIVPIYNMIVLFKISNTPLWMIILFFIPIGNIIISFMLYINLAKQFGKDAVFGIGIAFLPIIFLPILAFGKAEYIGDVSYDNIDNDMNNGFQNNNQPINNNFQSVNQPINNNFQSVNQPMDYNSVNNNISNDTNNNFVNNMNNDLNSNIVNNNINNDLGFNPQMNSEFINNDLNTISNNNVTEETPVISPVSIININETPSQINETPNQINEVPNQIYNTNDLSVQPIVQESQINQPIIAEKQVSTNNQPVQEINSNNIGFADLTNKIENFNPVNNDSVCPNCGNKYNAGDMFCIACGNKLN